MRLPSPNITRSRNQSSDSVPLSGNNTEFSRLSICNQPADGGPCQDSLPRWHYAADQGTCREFVYTGCGGNRNRFKGFEVCMGFCDAARKEFLKESAGAGGAGGGGQQQLSPQEQMCKVSSTCIG